MGAGVGDGGGAKGKVGGWDGGVRVSFCVSAGCECLRP
jgi:hypothetical protein